MEILKIFIPFAFGYFLSYLMRVVNAVIAPNLVVELELTAADLGLLTSANFLAFSAAQLPLGVLLDRFGPRLIEALLLLFAASGAFLFANAQSMPELITGRALIGLGTSACLMGAFKAYLMWVPSKKIPLINGLQMTAGGLGAVAGTVPMELALTIIDWRGLFVGFGFIAIFISLIIYLVVPQQSETNRTISSLTDQFGGLVKIYTNPIFWRIAPITIASQSMFLGTQSLWAGPWLSDVAGLDRDVVAHYLLIIAIAMVGGFLGMGTVANQLEKWGIKTITVSIGGMIIFALIQLPIIFLWIDLALPLWIAFGFFGTAGILSYASLPLYFPSEMAGRVITALNVFTFGGAFAAQWGMGLIINLWPNYDIVGSYDPSGYQAAFALMLAIQLAGLAWFFFFRKTKV